MPTLTIRITKVGNGAVHGIVHVTSAGDNGEWARLIPLDGSSARNGGADTLGAVLDILDTLGSRVAYALDQIIAF